MALVSAFANLKLKSKEWNVVAKETLSIGRIYWSIIDMMHDVWCIVYDR